MKKLYAVFLLSVWFITSIIVGLLSFIMLVPKTIITICVAGKIILSLPTGDENIDVTGTITSIAMDVPKARKHLLPLAIAFWGLIFYILHTLYK